MVAIKRPTARPTPLRVAARAVLGPLLLLLQGCLGPDLTPPPAPSVDPVRSPTSLSEQLLSGAAEYGATILIDREPALPGDPIESQADPFTARWSATVPLEPESENVFSVVAVDAAGNRGTATEVVIIHERPAAHSLELDLQPSVLERGVHVLQAVARLAHPEAEVSLAGQTVLFEKHFTWSGHDETLVTEASGVVGDSMRASVMFEDLYQPGQGFVRAMAEGGAEAEAFFFVHGDTEALASIELTLEAEVDGEEIGPDVSLAVPAGTVVVAKSVVRDVDGNRVDQPVLLTTDAPGATFDGERIDGLTVPGRWTVTAAIPAAGLVEAASLEVTPGPPTEIDLQLAFPLVSVGAPLPYSVEVHDAWSNAIDREVSMSTFPATAEIDTEGREIRFEEARDYDVIARVHLAEDVIETRKEVTVIGDAGGQPPHRVEVALPRPGSWVSAEAGTVQARVRAADDTGLVAILLRAEGPGVSFDSGAYLSGSPLEADVPLTLHLDQGMGEDEISLAPIAVNVHGQVTEGDPRLLRRRSEAPTVSPGYVLREVAGGEGSLLIRPRGVTLGLDGRAFVVGGDGRIVAVGLDEVIAGRRVKSGDLVLLFTFGGGLAWSAAVLRI